MDRNNKNIAINNCEREPLLNKYSERSCKQFADIPQSVLDELNANGFVIRDAIPESEGYMANIPNLRHPEPNHPLLQPANVAVFEGLRNPNSNHPILNLGKRGVPIQYRSDRPVEVRSAGGSIVAGILYATGVAYAMRVNIPPGHLGVSYHGGEPVILGEGNHLLLSPQHNLDKNSIIKITNDPIQLGPRLMIVSVPAGHIGVCHRIGAYEFLRPGRHVLEGAGYIFEKNVPMVGDLVELGPAIKIVTVPEGSLGVATNAGKYEILAAGRHVLIGGQYRYLKHHTVNSDHITLGPSVMIVTVPQGCLGLAEEMGRFEILAPGRHVLTGPTWLWKGVKSVSEEVVELGPVTIVTVPRGFLGISFDKGDLVILETGVNILSHARHIFKSMVNVGEKLIDLGPELIVTVFEGEVGISYKNGQLVVLDPGRYKLIKQEQRFDSFMTTKQITHKLEEVLVSTSDNVELLIKADVICKVDRPDVVARELGNQEAINTIVEERAKMVLNDIFRNHSSYEVAAVSLKRDGEASSAHKAVLRPNAGPLLGSSGHGLDKDKIDKDNRPSLLNDLEHDFMKLFAENVNRVGIRLINMGITKFKYFDKILHDQLSQRATISAKAISQLEQATADAKAAVIAAEAQSNVKALQATADANAIAKRLEIETRSVNEAELAKAEANAKALVIQAEAKKTAMMLEAEGKKALGQVLDACPGLKEIEITKANGDAFGKALSNTKSTTFFERSDNKMGWLNLMQARSMPLVPLDA